MESPISCILLVDDDENDNFFHKRTLEKNRIAQKVAVANTGLQALEYLAKSHQEVDLAHPNIIFLDINMPIMNGWEFLAEYEKLPESARANTLIIMLTTSLNPSDRELAEQNNLVNGFINKPLEAEHIKQIVEEHLERVG